MSGPEFTSYGLNALESLVQSKGRRLCALLYANSQPRVGTYLPLARAIAEAGHLPIVVFKSQRIDGESDDIDGYRDLHIGLVRHSVIAQVRGVDVIFSSEVVEDTPPGSHSVRIVHSLPDKNLSHNYAARIRRYPYLAHSADYLAIATHQSPARWSLENYTGILEGSPVGLDGLKRDRLDIVPAGYPKIDYLEAKIPLEAERKYLTFCPTSTEVGHSMVRAHGAEIIRELLRNFRKFEIVFRPYPATDEGFLASLKAEFGSHSRFKFDDTLTGVSFLRKTAMVITDNSSSAVSFSLATGRPSVFFDDAGPHGPLGEDLIGYRASNLRQILAAISNGLKSQAAWRSKILQGRESYLYNAGTASSYLAGKLPVFAAGKSDADWISVPRETLFAGRTGGTSVAEDAG